MKNILHYTAETGHSGPLLIRPTDNLFNEWIASWPEIEIIPRLESDKNLLSEETGTLKAVIPERIQKEGPNLQKFAIEYIFFPVENAVIFYIISSDNKDFYLFSSNYLLREKNKDVIDSFFDYCHTISVKVKLKSKKIHSPCLLTVLHNESILKFSSFSMNNMLIYTKDLAVLEQSIAKALLTRLNKDNPDIS